MNITWSTAKVMMFNDTERFVFSSNAPASVWLHWIIHSFPVIISLLHLIWKVYSFYIWKSQPFQSVELSLIMRFSPVSFIHLTQWIILFTKAILSISETINKVLSKFIDTKIIMSQQYKQNNFISPEIIFSSNDNKLKVFDVRMNQFEHQFGQTASEQISESRWMNCLAELSHWRDSKMKTQKEDRQLLKYSSCDRQLHPHFLCLLSVMRWRCGTVSGWTCFHSGDRKESDWMIQSHCAWWRLMTLIHKSQKEEEEGQSHHHWHHLLSSWADVLVLTRVNQALWEDLREKMERG